MIGRLAHRLNIPHAGWLAFGLLVVTIISQITLGVDFGPLKSGERIGFLVLWGFLFSLFVLATAYVRKAFRESRGIPGAWSEDLFYSTPLVCCLPLYWRTDLGTERSRMQCSNPFQLALIGVATDPVPQAGLDPGAETGEAKVTGPGEVAVQPSPGSWSTDLCGCRCTKECEGDITILCCSLLWSWWLQTRIAKRLGKVESFAKVGCILFTLESLPDLWGLVADAANLIGSTTESVLTFICYIPMTLFNYWLRVKVRERYQIQENFVCEDFLVSFFCYPCAVAQADRELTIRGEPVEV